MPIKIGFISLGCPKNQVDTEIMLSRLVSEGFEIVAEDIHADVIIINTCAFIQSAKSEAIETILDIAWLKKNRSLKGIVVCGCLSERYKDEILRELPEVDAVVGVGSINKIAEAVKAVLSDTSPDERYVSLESPDTVEFWGDRVLTTPEYTAYIKIAEGCDNGCSYCVIPSIRGAYRSRRFEDIISEARGLAEIGVRELSIVAQDITRYGFDLYGEYRLPLLLRELCKVDGLIWIRLFYTYPELITDELAEVIASEPKIAKYIDMPIQHINESVLSAMNRRGGSEAIRASLKKLRAKGIAVRTTVITGFPGESEEDFEELIAFVKEQRFERLGAFAFSPEEGTPAAELPGALDDDEREKRRDAVMEAQMDITDAYNQSRIGAELLVLCEGYDPVSEMHYGRSELDAPEIDGKIYFKSNAKVNPGTFLTVKINDVLDYDLIGEV